VSEGYHHNNENDHKVSKIDDNFYDHSDVVASASEDSEEVEESEPNQDAGQGVEDPDLVVCEDHRNHLFHGHIVKGLVLVGPIQDEDYLSSDNQDQHQGLDDVPGVVAVASEARLDHLQDLYEEEVKTEENDQDR